MARDRYGDQVDGEYSGGIPREHDPGCHNGWLGTEDHPTPCPACKPHLVRRAGNWTVDRSRIRNAS